MAKRKRLTPPSQTEAQARAPETKSLFPSYPLGLAPGPRPPIADVAGAAAATAALDEVSAELQAARAEGRLVQALPLEAVDAGHLLRDRLSAAADDDDMQSLIASLRARGQQTPIEVVETAPGRYGLISGWRRLNALRLLHDETGDAQFASVRALVRRPETAADAYVAMVEENEIRAGLSHYERARVVARTVKQGVYESDKAALNELFGSASRAKRSKIKSFLLVVRHLGDCLSFPTAIGERLGLKLAARLEEPGFGARLCDRLCRTVPQSPQAELALLERSVAEKADEKATGRGGKNVSRAKHSAREAGEEIAPGLWLMRDGHGLHLSGPGLSDETEARLRAVLTD